MCKKAVKCTPKSVHTGKASVLFKSELDEFTGTGQWGAPKGLGRTRPSLVPGRSGCCWSSQEQCWDTFRLLLSIIFITLLGRKGSWSKARSQMRTKPSLGTLPQRHTRPGWSHSLPRLGLFVLAPSSQLPPSSAQDARNNPAPFPLLPTASV